MSSIDRFMEYALAFEQTLATGDWTTLPQYFTEDASHRATGAGDTLTCDDRGRDAVLAGLRRAVGVMDLRFDQRIPEVLEGPVDREDGVYMTWRLTLKHGGLPDLVVEGDHLAVYAGDRIAHIEEHLFGDAGARVDAFLAEHGARLKPVPEGAST